jgi:hypothetical protein
MRKRGILSCALLTLAIGGCGAGRSSLVAFRDGGAQMDGKRDGVVSPDSVLRLDGPGTATPDVAPPPPQDVRPGGNPDLPGTQGPDGVFREAPRDRVPDGTLNDGPDVRGDANRDGSADGNLDLRPGDAGDGSVADTLRDGTRDGLLGDGPYDAKNDTADVAIGDRPTPDNRPPTDTRDGIILLVDTRDGQPDTADGPVDLPPEVGRDGATDSPLPPEVTWQGHEMLGRPTDHSVTVKAIADRAVEAYVEVGAAAGSYSASTTSATFTNGIIEVLLDGLSANSQYHYRLRYRAAGSPADFLTGTDHTFMTQRGKTSSFKFAIQSDSHLGSSQFNTPDLYQLTMQNIASTSPDFLLDLGDAVSLDGASESDATVRAKYLDQRAYLEIPGSSTAIFLVLGNHEREEGWKLDDFGTNYAASYPMLNANARKRYFSAPVPDGFYSGNTETLPEVDGDHLRGDYYAFEWGNALFVAIDPFWYTTTKPYAGTIEGETVAANDVVGSRWNWTLGSQQYQWLKHTLENSNAPLKFVFAHQLVGGMDDYGRGGALGAKYCELGGYNVDGTSLGFDTNRPGWSTPIHQLFVQNHVTAFFHGHDHVYAKEDLDGVVYQEVPMAADGSYGTGYSTNATDYAGASMVANSGYLRVTVDSTNATVEYVRSFLSASDGTNNSVAASYTVEGYVPPPIDGGVD